MYSTMYATNVKLQRQLNRRARGKEYAKWVLVLPPRIIRDLGWKQGEEFEFQIHGKTLRLRTLRLRPFARSPSLGDGVRQKA